MCGPQMVHEEHFLCFNFLELVCLRSSMGLSETDMVYVRNCKVDAVSGHVPASQMSAHIFGNLESVSNISWRFSA